MIAAASISTPDASDLASSVNSRRNKQLQASLSDLDAAMDREQLPSSEDTVPSSPSRAVFSDELARSLSPPSSPPGFPWEQQKTRDESVKAIGASQKSVFSVLGKRKALESASDNARPASKKSKPTSGGKQLTQMQISLGQEVQKKCKTCGMEYITSSDEDRKLHDKYHIQNVDGYDIGKDFAQQTRPPWNYSGAKAGDVVCAVNCLHSAGWKKRGQAVLEIVQRELGAVEIPAKDIWTLDRGCRNHKDFPRFTAFLYVRQSKCVGFLLAESIDKAYRVLEPSVYTKQAVVKSDEAESNRIAGSLAALKARQQAAAEQRQQLETQPLVLSQEATQARLGICRIWTSSTYRHQNIATTLLDTAFKHYNKYTDLYTSAAAQAPQQFNDQPKSARTQARSYEMLRGPADAANKYLVAFSQPTAAGTRLARKWFGKMFGWSVYVD